MSPDGAAYIDGGLTGALAALRRANTKILGWITLWHCSAGALASGKPTDGCSGEALTALNGEVPPAP